MESSAADAQPAFAPTGRRILCAEDHPQMAALMQKVLSRSGHHVVCVSDGQQALDWVVRDTFDIIVTDHHMPTLTGLELVTKVRELGFSGRIVLHTSRLTEAEEAAYRELNVAAILMKPGGILKLPELMV